jgi:hypothetical protein
MVCEGLDTLIYSNVGVDSRDSTRLDTETWRNKLNLNIESTLCEGLRLPFRHPPVEWGE